MLKEGNRMNRRGLTAALLVLLLAGCAPAERADVSAVGEESPVSSEAEAQEAVSSAPAEEPEEMTGPMLTAADVAEMDAGTILTAEQLAEVTLDELFYAETISDRVFQRMNGVSFGEGCTTAREELRYVRVLHTGFDGETHVGELVVNQSIAEDVVDIFRELYDSAYPIEKMHLVDDYGGDDQASMADNNTSCFNFRTVSGSGTLSRHALGLAIDVNPLYNPYVTARGYEPSNAGDYLDRTRDNPYQIDGNDLCYQLFAAHGFSWGGWWSSVQDYQHFEK